MSKREFQRFIGKVVCASKCTHGARVFTSRLLDFMCSLESGPAPVSEQARADIGWFMAYLKLFNGCYYDTATDSFTGHLCGYLPKGGRGGMVGKGDVCL